MSTEAQIIRCLERNTAVGRRQHLVFEDFLEIVEACLTMTPVHARAIRETGKLADDPPEIVHLWKRLKADYHGPAYFQNFTDAWSLLLESTSEPDGSLRWDDTIGNVYMQFGHPSAHSGQFFTPWPIAHTMALCTCHDLEAQVAQRVSKACEPVADVFPVTGLEDKPHLLRYVAERFLPSFKDRFEPVTVCDPAVGSGVMLLAVASTAPHWMSACGLVQYYGQDLDATCCQMARINLMLYGLNGFGVKCWAELPTAKAPAQIAPLVEAVKAELAQAEPDRAKIAAISTEARKLVQPNLL